MVFESLRLTVMKHLEKPIDTNKKAFQKLILKGFFNANLLNF